MPDMYKKSTKRWMSKRIMSYIKLSIQQGTSGYRRHTERKSKTKQPLWLEHILKANEITVTTTHEIYHKQILKPQRKEKIIFWKQTIGIDQKTRQTIQIQNLNKNPGVLPFNLGSARIKTDTHSFLSPPLYKRMFVVIDHTTPFHWIALYSAFKHFEYELNNVNNKFN